MEQNLLKLQKKKTFFDRNYYTIDVEVIVNTSNAPWMDYVWVFRNRNRWSVYCMATTQIIWRKWTAVLGKCDSLDCMPAVRTFSRFWLTQCVLPNGWVTFDRVQCTTADDFRRNFLHKRIHTHEINKIKMKNRWNFLILMSCYVVSSFVARSNFGHCSDNSMTVFCDSHEVGCRVDCT